MRLPPILLSFHYLGLGNLRSLLEEILKYNACDILIDSGAFSAHRLNKSIRLTDYIDACKWLLDYKCVWGCIQLDQIGNAEGSRRNLDRMVKAGVKPMPVLTTDSSLSVLDEYLAINNRVCIAGGLGRFDGVQKWSYDRYRKCTALHPKAEFHGLGYVRWPEMFTCGLRSADSSSHSAGERFGCLARFDRTEASSRKSGGVMNLQRQILTDDQPWSTIKQPLRDYLDGCGITKTQWRSRDKMNVGPCSFASFSMTCASVQQSLYTESHNVKAFLAASNWNAAMRCMVCAKHCLSNGCFDYWKAAEDLRKLMIAPLSIRNSLAVAYMMEI
jgi:hypothetical protein